MFRLIQIDPETLAVHVNAAAIAAHKRQKDFFDFLDLAREKGILHALLLACRENDLEVVSFGTSYLHELRHFGDLLLTPFGFYRIRTAFEFFVNLPRLILDPEEKLVVPLMSGMDPITRLAIDVDQTFEDSSAYRLGLTAFSRIRLINKQNHYDPDGMSILYGGDRILEALAYITQFEFLYQKFDTPETRRYFPRFFSPFTQSEFDLAYRWFTPDCHEMHPGESMPNNRVMTAILFASLCGSIQIDAPLRSGPHPKEIKVRDVSDKLPSQRYHRLAQYFKESPRSSVDDPDEAFELVDKACKKLFGRRILEEIDDDVQFSRQLVKGYSEKREGLSGPNAQLNAVPLLSELVEYRAVLLSGFRRYPRTFCTAQGFYEHTASILRPSLIYNSPQGVPMAPRRTFDYSRLGKQWIGLVDRRYTPPEGSKLFSEPTTIIYAAWTPVQGDNGSDDTELSTVVEDAGRGIAYITNPRLASRQGVYALLAPFYRWLLYGNKYRVMSEVENESLFEALGLDQSRLTIDPVYEDAEDISLPDAFLEFLRREENYCDVCNTSVSQNDCYVVSGRTMRQNKRVVEFYRSLSPDAVFKLLQVDWSDWLVCEADMKRFKFAIPRRAQVAKFPESKTLDKT